MVDDLVLVRIRVLVRIDWGDFRRAEYVLCDLRHKRFFFEQGMPALGHERPKLNAASPGRCPFAPDNAQTMRVARNSDLGQMTTRPTKDRSEGGSKFIASFAWRLELFRDK
jgi:hypothetical protein